MTDTRTVLSAAQRNGDFSGGTAIRDPLTGLPFPGNVIPADRINPIARKILDQYIPLPSSESNRVVRSPDVRDTREQAGSRFDDIFARALHGLRRVGVRTLDVQQKSRGLIGCPGTRR